MIKKFTYLLLLALLPILSIAQTVTIDANPGTSPTPGLGTSNYCANEAIYTDAEIGPGNFISAATPISYFSLNVAALGSPTTFNSVNIYFKDVPASTTTFTGGSYSLTGYTLVYSGSVTLSTTGFNEILLNTPYTRLAGSNLQVLITRADGVTHNSFSYNCANGNNTSNSISTTRRYNSTAAIAPGSTTLAVSAFRQSVRFAYKANNDAAVKLVYTLGKLPLSALPSPSYSAVITNEGISTLNNIPVTLNISGANSYTNIQNITTLLPGASTTVAFTAPTLTNLGTNNVSVSIPSDDINTNNTYSLSQLVGNNTWTYAYGPQASGGVGFTGGTGDFVAKFNSAINTMLSQVSVNFQAGGQPFKVGIWDATGVNGAPGNLIWQSNTFTSTAGVFVMPITPAVSITAGNFYIGVRQIGTVNVNFSFQSENPIRPQTFYYTSPSGSTTWTDFAPNNPFKFMIEPKLISPIDGGLSTINFGNGSNTTCASTNPGTVQVTVTNPGTNDIAIGAATVHLKIGGANTFSGTATNTSLIPSGSSGLVQFTGVTMNVGTNYDTAFVVLAGDLEPSNDTLFSTNTLYPQINAPISEQFAASPYVFNYLNQISGSGNWGIQTGTYRYISPYSGTTFAIFDCFTFSAGTISLLSSGCIGLPANGNSLCGNNSLTFMMSQSSSYSTSLDSIYINVSTDGGGSWTRIQGFGRYDASYAANVTGWVKRSVDLSAYQNQNIRIGFEGVSNYGDAVGIDNIYVGSQAIGNLTLSTSTTNSTALTNVCTDNDNWTYYSDATDPNKYLYAINWDPTNVSANTAAKAAATVELFTDASPSYDVTNIPGQQATFAMTRYWNVNLNNSTLTAPVHVRFFFDSTQLDAANQAATNFITNYGGTLKTPTWFKTKVGNYNHTQLTAAGIPNAIPLTNSNNGAKLNNLNYAEFQNITSFSGGTYAAGVGLDGLLAIELLAFDGRQLNSYNELNWKTSGNSTAVTFVIEKSKDGKEFISMTAVASKNNGTTEDITYTQLDKNPFKGNNFYRLKMIDKNGTTTYSKTIQLNNKNGGAIVLFPNPTKGELNIQFGSEYTGDVQIVLTDMVGKIVYKNSIQLQHGGQLVTIPSLNLAKGTYMAEIKTTHETVNQKIAVE